MTNARDRVSMGETAKSYCEEWLKNQIYGRCKIIDSKFFDKGNLCESDAIDFVSAYFPEMPFLIKNEKNYESEYITGTPDLILADEVIDIKCPWDYITFPLFENQLPEKDYYWQLQSYMDLTGCSKGRVIYVLMDTPLELIEKEIHFNPECEDEIIAYHTYRGIPDKYKVKCFDIQRNDQDIEAIKKRVNECREYINNLQP